MSKHLSHLRAGFTLAEVMCSLLIFSMAATAGTYMVGAMNANEMFFRAGTSSQSEVEFAIGRMVENIRAAGVVSSPTSTTAVHTLTLTNPSGATVSYAVSGNNLTETVGTATSTLVHGTSSGPVSFSVSEVNGNSKAFTITISVGTEQVISRSITVFGRNL